MSQQFIENVWDRELSIELTTTIGGPIYPLTYLSETFAGTCRDIICQSSKEAPTFSLEKARIRQWIRKGQSHLVTIKEMLKNRTLSLYMLPKIIDDYEAVQIIQQFRETLDDIDEQIFETVFTFLIETDNYITLAGALNSISRDESAVADKFLACAKRIEKRVMETLHTRPKYDIKRRLDFLSYICDHTENQALHILVKQELHENYTDKKKVPLSENELQFLEEWMTEEELTAAPGKAKKRDDN